MKKVFKNLLSAAGYAGTTFAIAAICISTNGIKSQAAEIVQSGTSGDLNWSIDSDGLLTIEGTGNYEYEQIDDGETEGESYITPWNTYSEQIKQAVVEVDGITSTSGMFEGCDALNSVDISGLDTSQVTEMCNMFYGCSALTSLDVSGLDTGQVTDMAGMFYDCQSLTNLDVSGFDTSQVIEMAGVFENCSGLTDLDVSGFDTSRVTNMSSMFDGCDSLASLDVSGFDTGEVTTMWYMFSGCSELTSLDVSGLDTSQVAEMSGMFYGCGGLKELDVSNFDTSQVTDMVSMFEGCSSLTSLNISNFDLNEMVAMEMLIDGCDALTSVTMPPNLFEAIELPVLENYVWKDSNQVVCTVAHTDLDVPMTYTRGAKATEESNNNVQKTEPVITIPDIPQPEPVAPGNPKPVGTKMAAVAGAGSYTVTDANTANPTVAFDGVEDENAEAVAIPEYVTIDGIKYQVTTVSIEAFEKTLTESTYEVIDNSVKNLTVEYTGTTNTKKKSVSIPEYETYKGVKFKVKSVKAKSFKNNKKLTNIKIASGITVIGNSTFEGCTNLKNVIVGKSLQTIGKNAFKNCKKLAKITLKSKKLKSVGKNALKGVNAECKIKVPSVKAKRYAKVFKGKGQKDSVKVAR